MGRVGNYELDEAATFVDAWNALLKRPCVDSATVQLLFNEARGQFD